MARDWQEVQDGDRNQPYTLATLVKSLRDYLGTKSGIGSEDVEVEELKALINNYTPTSEEWLQYGKSDPSRNYTRLLVDDINGKCNLLFIVWNPGKGSPVHDHANAHCVMKILKSSLKETVYHMPQSQTNGAEPLQVKKETVYQADQVAYISDKIGLHRVANPGLEDVAVSLHLYTPPNAADYGYNIYDPKTGRSSHVR